MCCPLSICPMILFQDCVPSSRSLGRSQPAISITLSNIERSKGWVSRLLPLRKQVKSANGNKIFVYSEGIFDLLIDMYENEYLLRFSKPRRGNKNNATDIEEIRKFWKYLHDIEQRNECLAFRQQTDLPDIPAMSLKDILALIWDKVFNIRIGIVASLIFAVCFEAARRYFSVSLWLSIIPITVICACIILIHRRHAPDTLSDIGAGTLLFLMLWISGSMSLYKSEPLKVAQNITLSPALSSDNIHFNISAAHFAVRFNLCKQNILNSKEEWLEARKVGHKVFLMPSPVLSSTYGTSSVLSLVYGINTSTALLPISESVTLSNNHSIISAFTLTKGVSSCKIQKVIITIFCKFRKLKIIHTLSSKMPLQ